MHLNRPIKRDTQRENEMFKHQHKKYLIPFPFDPYEQQKQMMSSVMDALDARSNALIESPTGTGKTLCMLSSVMTWISQNRKQQTTAKPVKLIYLSRTHQQLQQVVRQIKKTCFLPKILTAASRDHACINSRINKLRGHELEVQCRKAIRAPDETVQNQEQQADCSYFQGIRAQVYRQKTGLAPNAIRDLEEVKTHAEQKKYCPFFLARQDEIRQQCDVIFMPYNYLLSRNSFGIYAKDIENAILVFDQAHNVQNASCDGNSFKISLEEVGQAIKQACILEKKFFQVSHEDRQNQTLQVGHFEELGRRLKIFATALENRGDRDLKSEDDMKNGHYYEKQALFELCRELLTSKQNQNEDVLGNIATMTGILSSLMATFPTEYTWSLDRLCGFLQLIQSLYKSREDGKWDSNLSNHYKGVLSISDHSVHLELWCLNSAIGMKYIIEKKPYSIILTSGTLSPLDFWEVEMGILFKTKVSTKHVIKPSQIMVECIQKSLPSTPEEGPINMMFDYKNQNNRNLIRDLGGMLIRLAEAVPNGILIMFSSYSLMDKIHWGLVDMKIWEKLNFIKEIYTQPKSTEKMKDVRTTYEMKAKTKKGAIMLCVFRGKIAQGIDMADDLCRAVLLIGVPFPPTMDPKIIHKKKYFELQSKLSEEVNSRKIQKLDGNLWYLLQTVRAVNQAIGRVIRHIHDYGVILFFDGRYSNNSEVKSKLSSWARDNLRACINFEELVHQTKDFFLRNQKQFQGKVSSTHVIDRQLSTCDTEEEEPPQPMRLRPKMQLKETPAEKTSIEKYVPQYDLVNSNLRPNNRKSGQTSIMNYIARKSSK